MKRWLKGVGGYWTGLIIIALLLGFCIDTSCIIHCGQKWIDGYINSFVGLLVIIIIIITEP